MTARLGLAVVAGVSFAVSPAGAEPTLLSHHYSSTGGRLLAPYGRSLKRGALGFDTFDQLYALEPSVRCFRSV